MNKPHPKNERHPNEEEPRQEMHPLLQKIYEHIKTIAMVIGGIILIAACFSGYQFYHQHRLNKAQAEFGDILAQEATQEKIQKLKTFLDKAPGKMRQAVFFELASTSMQNKNFAQATTYWEQLKNHTKDINIQTVAALGQAKSCRLQGQYPKALEILESILPKAPKPYHQSIYTDMATTAELDKNWQKALTAYKEIQSSQNLMNQQDSYIEYKITQLEQKVSNEQS
jgi:predicted negative regulator of RcsB-dependent stress response